MNMVGHAVDGGAALVGYGREGLERVEVLGGDHHGGAVDDAVEGAHYAAEAVVEGHGNAQAVVLVHLHAVADVEGVGDDVVMGEGRALGVSGGAGGVLDVDGVVRAALGLTGLEVCGWGDPLRLGAAGRSSATYRRGSGRRARRGAG